MNLKIKKSVCVVVNSRANYGRIKSVLNAIKNHPRLDLQIVIGASALLYRFGNVLDVMKEDGFQPNATVYTIVEGETPTTMAKSTGLAIMELSTIFENLCPDIVLTVADRFETLATAVAASYMNICLAHTQGGEITGSIDESVRHAISKLAHVHFPATQKSRINLLRMGESPNCVFMTGCPAIDPLLSLDLSISPDFFKKYKGVGPDLDPTKPYLVVLQHPVTTEYGLGYAQIKETLEAVHRVGMQTCWLWPNVDAGSDDISKGLREFREHNPLAPIHFYRNFSVEDYAKLIFNCACLIGNSSSALREGSFLGVPAVNIGSRQNGREHGQNVINVNHDSIEIYQKILKLLDQPRPEKSLLFGDGRAGERIADILATRTFGIQKELIFSLS